jgi:hypothetical protein
MCRHEIDLLSESDTLVANVVADAALGTDASAGAAATATTDAGAEAGSGAADASADAKADVACADGGSDDNRVGPTYNITLTEEECESRLKAVISMAEEALQLRRSLGYGDDDEHVSFLIKLIEHSVVEIADPR